MGPMVDALLAAAEEPGLVTPPGPGARLVPGEGFTLVARSGGVTVERVRLAPGGAAAAVASARGLARALAATDLVWWVGALASPPGLVAALVAEGLVPFPGEPVLRTVTTDRPPPAPAGVEVVAIEDVATYRTAMELDADVWGIPPAERDVRRARRDAVWESERASGLVDHHLALVDGRPAGVGRMVAVPEAGVLMGGAVAPWARGRGAYRALVHARWQAAASRGLPRLVTSAGAMSAPILERLGFTAIGEVRLLRDPLL